MGQMEDDGEKLTLARFVRQAIVAAVVMGMSFSCYLLVLKWRGPAASIVTQLPWEGRWTPFWPSWIYLYLFPYLAGPLLLGLLSRQTFSWYIIRGLLAVALSVSLFIFFPTKTQRPSPDSLGDGFTANYYRSMVGIDDPPANAAPSLHVSLSFLLALALFWDFPLWWPVTVVGIGLVWLATLFTWQHHLIDVITGVLLGALVALPLPWPLHSLKRPKALANQNFHLET